MLTREGLDALVTGTLDCASPDPRLIARPGERPAGIYFWAVYAPGTLAYAAALIVEKMSEAPYDGVPFFSHPNTREGYRFTESLGFRRGTAADGIFAPDIYIHERRRAKKAERAALRQLPQGRQAQPSVGERRPQRRGLDAGRQRAQRRISRRAGMSV